ncbi:hypothetical protein EV360DRAFT_81411 [Lentinula raphanica]|nr:hypothetical protein EV360DRAFT_81411 [Lentinula raphanica]
MRFLFTTYVWLVVIAFLPVLHALPMDFMNNYFSEVFEPPLYKERVEVFLQYKDFNTNPTARRAARDYLSSVMKPKVAKDETLHILFSRDGQEVPPITFEPQLPAGVIGYCLEHQTRIMNTDKYKTVEYRVGWVELKPRPLTTSGPEYEKGALSVPLPDSKTARSTTFMYRPDSEVVEAA